MRYSILSLALFSLLALGCEKTAYNGPSESATRDRHVERAGDMAAKSTEKGKPTVNRYAESMDGAGSSDESKLDLSVEPDMELPTESAHSKKNDRPQSGTLTAGSFDDNENFNEYREFLSTILQSNSDEFFPDYSIGKRIVIQVTNDQGKPIGNARVQIRYVDQNSPSNGIGPGKTLFDQTTASDGRLLLLTGMEGCGNANELIATVIPPDGSQPVVQQFSTTISTLNISISSEPALPTQLDLALVIDTTGSMGDELEYLKSEIDSIATAVHSMFPNVDQRYSLIVYRDQGDQYVSRKFDFTDSLAGFRKNLSAQSANGGGDYPEAMHVAVELAGELDWRDGNTARVMFLVGDAPPHQEDAGRTLEAAKVLREQSVRVYPLAGSGVRQQAEFIMRAMSFMTMGQYLFLTDHSGVGNPHAAPSVSEYQVERLDRLMVRMISSELAGKRLMADEIIAIEKGKQVEMPVLPNQQVHHQSQNMPVMFVPHHGKKPWSPIDMISFVGVVYVMVSLLAIVFGAYVGFKSFVRWRVSKALETGEFGGFVPGVTEMQKEYQG